MPADNHDSAEKTIIYDQNPICQRKIDLSGSSPIYTAGFAPDEFQVVIVPHIAVEQVHHEIEKIHNHPVALFHAGGTKYLRIVFSFHLPRYFVGKCAYLPVARAGGYHEIIGNRTYIVKVEEYDILGISVGSQPGYLYDLFKRRRVLFHKLLKSEFPDNQHNSFYGQSDSLSARKVSPQRHCIVKTAILQSRIYGTLTWPCSKSLLSRRQLSVFPKRKIKLRTAGV